MGFSKHEYTAGDEYFTKWRMRVFITVQLMYHLVCRTSMIDLIKVRTVHRTGTSLKFILLIKQILILISIHRLQFFAIAIQEHKL